MTSVNGLGELNEETGHTIATNGQVQVDFVWGNQPMQPNDDRDGENLDFELGDHVNVQIGWSNFPAYIPNYEGDQDAALEVTVPNIVGLSWNDSVAALQNVGLVANGFFENIEVTSVTSSGKTITLNVDDSFGVKKGQTIWVNVTDNADPAVTTSWNEVVVTSSTATTIKFAVSAAPSPALNITATSSSVYGDSTTLSQDLEPGTVVNAGTTVTVRNIWD